MFNALIAFSERYPPVVQCVVLIKSSSGLLSSYIRQADFSLASSGSAAPVDFSHHCPVFKPRGAQRWEKSLPRSIVYLYHLSILPYGQRRIVS